jgi:lysophospholipase L1-like esterase
LSRRQFVRLGGAGLAGTALLGVAGCGGEDSASAARHGPTEGWIATLMGNDAPVGHVVLLGDSIFDNAAYVAGAPDVIRQVRKRLPQGSKATLVAVDGSKIGDVGRQLRRVPLDATHLVLSIGGNDALGSSDFLSAPARSTAEALSGLADIGDDFERGYLAMLTDVLAHELPTAICTIYYPRFPDAALQKMAVAALTVFNDCIVRAAFAHGLPLLDLRLICTEAGDYANPIEPSAQGGEKIARAIAEFVERRPIGDRTEVIT